MARLTLEEVLAKCGAGVRALNTELFSSGGAKPGGAVRTKLECAPRDEPLAEAKTEAADTGKYFVRVVSYRVRLLDEDNLSSKWAVDSLRYAGILPSDAPETCRIITTQEKVKTRAEQRTEIFVERSEGSWMK